ncbi:hypothetical protein [Eupransor demetentiae]|uniref:Uncharacterized protein n=1 Tax=Eupransor demetentiae TaxID=3109584 RepID=A0ABP0EPZ7_9LACO|nr:hypothetical protein R54876_GBNLAHCA_00035 [Lactobacillaceae bacterium LMG 33000]
MGAFFCIVFLGIIIYSIVLWRRNKKNGQHSSKLVKISLALLALVALIIWSQSSNSDDNSKSSQSSSKSKSSSSKKKTSDSKTNYQYNDAEAVQNANNWDLDDIEKSSNIGKSIKLENAELGTLSGGKGLWISASTDQNSKLYTGHFQADYTKSGFKEGDKVSIEGILLGKQKSFVSDSKVDDTKYPTIKIVNIHKIS